MADIRFFLVVVLAALAVFARFAGPLRHVTGVAAVPVPAAVVVVV